MNKSTNIKNLVTFFALAFLVNIISITSYAQEDMVDFDNGAYTKSTLSDETLEWLEWYNQLSTIEREYINYVPYELQNQTRALFSVLEASSHYGISTRLFPLSGGEPLYNPTYWNDSSRIKKANCYAYSMDVLCSTDMKLQPGQLAGSQFTSLTASNIINAAKLDGPYLGNGRTLVTTNANSTSTSKSYKVALVIGKSDYHWYVQNSDGYWSHKPGQTNVTDVDASGNYITDPQTCNRNYSYDNYSTWGGYVMVTRK